MTRLLIDAILVWIILDWLGNPNRGRFRPKGEQFEGTRSERRAARIRQRAEDARGIGSQLSGSGGTSGDLREIEDP